jgi:flagellar hook protein FlgE
VANNGEANAIEISLSGMQLVTAAGEETVSLPFTSTQTAVGESASTDVIVYDSLGIPLNVHITAVLESRTSTATTYRWFADSPNNDPLTGSGIAVGTGLIRFDGEGNYSSSNDTTVSIERRHVSSAALAFNLTSTSYPIGADNIRWR